MLIDRVFYEEGEEMSVFILEDDVIQAQQLKKMISDICATHHILYDFIEATSKSTDIIEKIPLTINTPIYFLDIEIKNEEKRGLEVAQEIRKHDARGIIVFVTTHSEFAPLSYQYMVSALTFIDKALPYEERYRMFEEALLHYQKSNEVDLPVDDFIIENTNTTIRLPFDEVEYIETDKPHRLTLVATNRMLSFYGTLKEVEAVDDRLLRCHQSYIVNKTKIATYNQSDKMIHLKSGKQVPVSRRLAKKVRLVLRGEL